MVAKGLPVPLAKPGTFKPRNEQEANRANYFSNIKAIKLFDPKQAPARIISAAKAMSPGYGGRAPAPAAAPRAPSSGARSGGGRGYGGGGGGGGGGVSAAAAAQSQMDYLRSLLAGGAFNVNAAPYDQMRSGVNAATAQDQAAATGAYNSLDQWLGANRTNPYADVQLNEAQRAPSMNAYLQSQGGQGLNEFGGANPEDTGYGAFGNVLKLLGANQLAGQQSRGAESQMARTFAGQQIGAADNAYLMNIANQQAAAQTAMDAEKRKIMLELAALVGQGAKAPDLTGLI